MKTKDYFRLAKISLKSRKQTTRSTVRGISFGMILLIPVIFISLGLFSELSKTVNKNPQLLYARIETATKRSNLADKLSQEWEWPVISISHGENISEKLSGIDTVKFEQIKGNSSEIGLNFDNLLDKQFNLYYLDQAKGLQYNFNNVAAIVDLQNSTNNTFVTSNAKKVYGGSAFAAGADFTSGGKGQVIVSEFVTEFLELRPENVIGKELTVTFDIDGNQGVMLDDDNIVSNNSVDDENKYMGGKTINLFYNYKIVGVIKKELTISSVKINEVSHSAHHLMSNLFFLSDESLYMPGGDVLEPVITSYEKEQDESVIQEFMHVATYTQENFDELNKEYIGLGVTSFSSHNNNYNVPTYISYDGFSKSSYFFDAKTFAEQDKAVKAITREISPLFLNANNSSSIGGRVGGGVYNDVKMLYEAFTYIILFLSVMGGIIFFAAIVNLFNSIVHSVDSRRHYLGVMRAIGAKNSTIPKMYFIESIALFRRSLLWIIIFAGVICGGIKLLLDYSFNYINSLGILPFKLGISISFIPISIGIGLALLVVIGLVFSYTCSRKVSKQPIMSILGDV